MMLSLWLFRCVLYKMIILEVFFSTTIIYEEAWIGSIWNTFVASSISTIGFQIAFWWESETEAGVYRMAGQFSFGRDGNSTAHSPTLATLASMPEENRTVILTLKCTLSILDLSHFLFYQKVHHSSLCCSQAFIFFFCAHSVSCLAPYVAMANI